MKNLDDIHLSDCAVNNEPAMPAGDCSCNRTQAIWLYVERQERTADHMRLCACLNWPSKACVSYPEKRDWHVDAERAVKMALALVNA